MEKKGARSKSAGRKSPQKEMPMDLNKKYSRKFLECQKIVSSSKKLADIGNLESAKKQYMKSRVIYMALDYHERKEIYHDLLDLYNRLGNN